MPVGQWALMPQSFLPQFTVPPEQLFIYVDEGGNFDFSLTGTRYLVLTAVSAQMPFWWYPRVPELKMQLLCSGVLSKDFEYLHASEDPWPARRAFYELIGLHTSTMRVDSVIIDKRKAHPKVREDQRFYPEHLSTLLRYVVRGWQRTTSFPETIVITDRIPHERKRKAIEGAVKTALKESLDGSPFRVFHHHSRSHAGLQVADYCCWAVQRKWDKGETELYKLIAPAIHSEFDVYSSGTTYFY
jgi:Protein of unknown function (DUF3800)